MTQLRVADGLTLPLEAVTEKLAFLGRTGGGKTYAAMKLAEEMYRAGAQFLVLDPVGKWWGLRLAADGKAPGLPIPVFGGLHGDVPLEPTAGKLVADLIADRGISVVLDVSQFESDAAKARFASDFADRFFFRKKSQPSACHLFLEEAQEFVPQNPQRDEATMLHRFTRYIKLGRNFGLGCSLISQRPQEVNKKCLNQTELLFCFQMTGPQERKTVEGWIAEKGIDEDIAGELPKLKQGSPHVWSPAWLQVSKVVKIREKQTYDASSTPKVGARKVEEQPLAPIDLERIRKDMAATIEKAKAEDPKLLRQEVAHLRSELTVERKKHQPAPGQTLTKVERKEVPVLKDGQLARLEKVGEQLGHIGDQFATKIAAAVQPVVVIGQEITAALAKLSQNGNGGHRPKEPPGYERFKSGPGVRPIPRERPAPVRQVQRSRPAPADGERKPLRTGALRMMGAVASRYPVSTTEGQMAQLAKMARTGGTFKTYMSDLRIGGYVLDRGDEIVLTDTGWEAIGQTPGDTAPQTTDEVFDLYAGILRTGPTKMLRELMAIYPRKMSQEELGAATNFTASGGTFKTYLSDLRKAGLVEEESEMVGASEYLMNPAGVGA